MFLLLCTRCLVPTATMLTWAVVSVPGHCRGQQCGSCSPFGAWNQPTFASLQSSSGTVPQYMMVAAYQNFVNLCVCSPEYWRHRGALRAGSGQGGIIPFSSALLRSHLEHCVKAWAPSTERCGAAGGGRARGCSKDWSSSAMETGWGDWGCSVCRREASSRTSLQPSTAWKQGDWLFTRADSGRTAERLLSAPILPMPAFSSHSGAQHCPPAQLRLLAAPSMVFPSVKWGWWGCAVLGKLGCHPLPQQLCKHRFNRAAAALN